MAMFQCIAKVSSPVFHVAESVIDTESFSKRPCDESFPKSPLSNTERKLFYARREDDEVSGWHWIIVHPMKCLKSD